VTQVLRYLSDDGMVRISSVKSTELVRGVLPKRPISSLVATILARATTAAVLMVSHLKLRQKVGLHFRGDGPVSQLFAEADYGGSVRSYCARPEAVLPEGEEDFGQGLGQGTLEVVITQPGQAKPYRSVTDLVDGQITNDVLRYFAQGQQTPSIIALGSVPDETGCAWAGGYLIELLPGYDPSLIDLLEAIERDTPGPASCLASGGSASDLVAPFLSAISCSPLSHGPEYRAYCPCSRARILNSVVSLGPENIKEMVQENRVFDVTCQFCGKVWKLTPLHLQSALRRLQVAES